MTAGRYTLVYTSNELIINNVLAIILLIVGTRNDANQANYKSYFVLTAIKANEFGEILVLHRSSSLSTVI